MPFGEQTRVGPKNHVFDRVPICPLANTIKRSVSAAMRAVATITAATCFCLCVASVLFFCAYVSGFWACRPTFDLHQSETRQFNRVDGVKHRFIEQGYYNARRRISAKTATVHVFVDYVPRNFYMGLITTSSYKCLVLIAEVKTVILKWHNKEF